MKAFPISVLALCVSAVAFVFLLIHKTDVIFIKNPNEYSSNTINQRTVLNCSCEEKKPESLFIITTVPPEEDVFSIDEILEGPPAQDDPRIVNEIKKFYLYPPSTEEYNLNDPDKKDQSMGQAAKVREVLKNMRNGFFVECGALDGETRSNTLVLERELGWNGLLIEGDPKNFMMVKQKNRKAWTSNSCLAIKPYPQKVQFKQAFNVGKVNEDIKSGTSIIKPGHAEVQCFPFYSLLSALNKTAVDYFSLDVEGNELDVLRTIPFQKVFIKVLTVEFIHDKEGRQPILDLMASNSYTSIGEITHIQGLANDFVFVHNSLKPEKMLF